MKHITLEMSLKPFKKVDDGYIRQVCLCVFEQWKPLVKHADTVSVMLWTADGSEILEYKGDLNEELEWCRYIGGGTTMEAWDKKADPDGLGLHTRNYLYMENPPVITYGTLKKIIAAIKQAGREVLGGKTILVGETFDPGPEFADSDFKYNRHPEICVGDSMGKASMVCCYSVLKGDHVRYAGFPDGIPDQTPFGTFLGRQSRIFLTDMGFDYLWLSNGFGFGTEAWHTTGAIFDGEHFHADRLAQVQKQLMEFWTLFRKECPDIPLHTRGTNLSAGIDLATDGVPLQAIYSGGYKLLPPPNSPWAALNGDFGLELMGHMSRIAQLPGEDILFRYYIHDPWWVNSPWYDRYGGQPHDIYLPMALGRISESGAVNVPTHMNILTIDNSYGDMPDACVREPLPHLLKAVKDAPDAPSPLVWVYPFDEYQSARDEKTIREAFFGDWFIRGAVNHSLPLSSVVSTGNFIKSLDKNSALYDGSVLVSTVPAKDTAYEDAVLGLIGRGGRVIFYGCVDRASERFLRLIGVRLTEAVSGELKLGQNPAADVIRKSGYAGVLNHRPLLCGGGIDTVWDEGNPGAAPLAFAEGRVIGTYGESFAWVRGTSSNTFVPGEALLIPDAPSRYFPGELLMRLALEKLGYSIRFTKEAPDSKTPVMMLSRNDNAFWFSVFSPETTMETKLKFPLGAPLLLGYEAKLEDGFGCYHFPRADHRECRAFIEQAEGIIVCREVAPVSYQMRRRIEISGLKNATVRFFPEKYCLENINVLLNSEYPFLVGEAPDGGYVKNRHGAYYEARNVTGSLLFSMPAKPIKSAI